MDKAFRIVRREAQRDCAPDPLDFCLDLVEGRGPYDLQLLLSCLSPEWQDYVIASAYTLLLPSDRRRALGAYFTPPHLVHHLLRRMKDAGIDLLSQRIHDPAAGGAAFIVPLVRTLLSRMNGAEKSEMGRAIEGMVNRVSGREIDPGLATLANALMNRMFANEFGIDIDVELILSGDSLQALGGSGATASDFDGIIGNPPYAKIGREAEKVWRSRFEDIAQGQMNLYAMFVRRSLDALRNGGLLGFIIPTSFLGSPDYALFRRRVVELADLLVLDVVEKRSGLFLDVVQDACFMVLRRRVTGPGEHPAQCSVVHPDGDTKALGRVMVSTDGSPWQLPGTTEVVLGNEKTLAELGYRLTVGYLVANRQPELLRASKGPGIYPLIWPKAVGVNGQLDHRRPVGDGKKIWVSVQKQNASYLVRSPAVVIQRTSNRKQTRRLNAAAVDQGFIDRHGGFVGENHVLIAIPTSNSPALGVADLAQLLNSEQVNLAFDRVCGTISVSARLLAGLKLPAFSEP